MTTLVFDDIDPTYLLSINEQNKRGHWARTKAKQYWIPRLVFAVYGLKPIDRVHVDVLFRFPNNRIRDTGNLYPVAKILVDCLVTQGVIPGDDDRYVEGPHLWRDRPNGPYRVTVRLTELTEETA